MDSTQKPLSWTNLLEDYIKKGKQKTKEQQEEEVTRLFMKNLEEEKKSEDATKSKIPRFFFKKPTNFSDIYLSVRSEAKQKFLYLKQYEHPQKESLKLLWGVLKQNISPPKDQKEFQMVEEFVELDEDYL